MRTVITVIILALMFAASCAKQETAKVSEPEFTLTTASRQVVSEYFAEHELPCGVRMQAAEQYESYNGIWLRGIVVQKTVNGGDVKGYICSERDTLYFFDGYNNEEAIIWCIHEGDEVYFFQDNTDSFYPSQFVVIKPNAVRIGQLKELF